MPKFTVKALEKFLVETTYTDVEADTQEEAVELCRTGKVGYDCHEIVEGDDEWIKVLEVEEE